MLRTGLIRIDGEKVASVESNMSIVSLHHVTPSWRTRCRRLSGHLVRHRRRSVTAKGTTLRMTWHRDANQKQDI